MCDHDHDGLDWEDIGLAGALAEEIAEEEKERQRVRRLVEPELDENEEDSD
jgi:hypothetical protein